MKFYITLCSLQSYWNINKNGTCWQMCKAVGKNMTPVYMFKESSGTSYGGSVLQWSASQNYLSLWPIVAMLYLYL